MDQKYYSYHLHEGITTLFVLFGIYHLPAWYILCHMAVVLTPADFRVAAVLGIIALSWCYIFFLRGIHADHWYTTFTEEGIYFCRRPRKEQFMSWESLHYAYATNLSAIKNVPRKYQWEYLVLTQDPIDPAHMNEKWSEFRKLVRRNRMLMPGTAILQVERSEIETILKQIPENITIIRDDSCN